MPGCDPTARFIAPFCDWRNVHDLGAGHVTTAVAARGDTIYAGWVASGGNPSPAFGSGIDTNAGGTWHTVNAPNLPQRYLSGLRVDAANANHVFAVPSGYSRHWIPGRQPARHPRRRPRDHPRETRAGNRYRRVRRRRPHPDPVVATRLRPAAQRHRRPDPHHRRQHHRRRHSWKRPLANHPAQQLGAPEPKFGGAEPFTHNTGRARQATLMPDRTSGHRSLAPP
jgi:hypothetical protein